jgi:hypothetical protein
LRPFAPAPEFHMVRDAPPELTYVLGDPAPPALPATLAGVGVLRCTLHPGLHLSAPAAVPGSSHPRGMGALGRDEPGYRGEAYMASGKGSAHLVKFTPNRVEVELAGATPGDLLALNQNWDPGWRADGNTVIRDHDTVGFPVRRAAGRTVFTYRPRFLWFTAPLALLTLSAMIAAVRLGPARTRVLWALVWTNRRGVLSFKA